ncbi:MAG: ABC transporter ATP-binding protein [Oligoflexales bacterium]|nr:ABC transporter ATP-binding protein [Oligoflexales bacterium]
MPIKDNSLLKAYLRPHIFSFVLATFCAISLGFVSASVYSLFGPALQVLINPNQGKLIPIAELVGKNLGFIIKNLSGKESFNAIELWQNLPVYIISLSALRGLFTFAHIFLWERASELIAKEIRSNIIKKYLLLNPASRLTLDDIKESEISSSMTVDINLIREYIVHFYGGLPRELIQIFFYMLTLILLSPSLFLVFIICIGPVFYFSSKLGKKLRERSFIALKDYSILIEWLQQRLLGIETIKHFNTELLEIKKMRSLTDSLFFKLLRAVRIKSRTSPMLEMIAIFSMVGVLYFSMSDSFSNSQSVTGSIQFSFFSTLAILSQSAARVGRYFNSNREGDVAIDRISQLFLFLDKNKADKFSNLIKSDFADTTITFDNIFVRYPETPQDQFVLRNFSFSFKKGKIYCICGPSGAGKSTLFNIILGTVPLHSGKIFSQSQSTTNDKKIDITYMPQNFLLAPTSIALNISYPDTDFCHEKIIESSKKVQLYEFINNLPNKFDSVIGKEGLTFSGGQSQRVLLARIFYHKTNLILIDEGTSALDPEIEKLVYTHLRQLTDLGSTIIIIAHRSTIFSYADEILLINNGMLEVSGCGREITSTKEFARILGTKIEKNLE